jgi:hypothetical protein
VELILANTNAAGVAVLSVIGLTMMGFGVAILKDWRGIGSTYHRIAMRSHMPASGFYRDFRTFQLVNGVGAILFGLFAVTVMAVFVT